MNTRLGKSFGLAFMVAVGILAVMFALGTFNAQKAGAEPVGGSVSLSLEQIGSVDQDGTNMVEATVKFTDDEGLAGADAIVITLGGGLAVGTVDEVTVTGTGSGGLPFEVTDESPSPSGGDTITIALPDPLVAAVDADEQAGVEAADAVPTTMADSEITVVIATGITAPIAADDQEFTAAVGSGTDAATNAVTSAPVTNIIDDALSGQDAGAGVSVTIEFTLATDATIDAGDDVVIEMKSFQLPATIDPDAISIRGSVSGTSTPSQNAADVGVSGSKITVEIPDMDDDSGNLNDLTADGPVTIRIRSRAGIENPTTAGDAYVITVTHSSGTLYERNPGAINATLKVDPDSGIEGEELTVSGVGYSDGTVTIYHTGGAEAPDAGTVASAPEDFERVGSATVSDGVFSTSITAGDTFEAAGNDLVARGPKGEWGPTDTFTLNGAINIPDSVTKGTNLTVKVSKWSAGPITRATINGEDMYTVGDDGVDMVGEGDDATPTFKQQDPDEDKTAEFKIRVGSGALLGEQTLVLYATEEGEDEESAGQKNIDVIGIALTVSPSVAVVGQEVTVTGTGFNTSVGDEPAKIMALTIGGVPVIGQIDADDRGVASGGRVIAAFNVPNDSDLAEAKDYTISLSDDGGRTGSATLTIPERTLTASPTEGRIGTTIDLSGTGWPSGTDASLVMLKYGGSLVTTATSDSSGSWSASITVPDSAEVGKTNKVLAEATVGTETITKEADHKTPDPVVTLSPAQAQRGDTITVSGANFNTFRPVTIVVGDSTVTPSPAPTTDADGSFSTEILVPGLSLGNKNLKVSVNNVPVVEFLEIVATPVVTTKAAADVFEPLATAGVLTVVWHFDNDTKGWSFYDPRPAVAAAVDLTMVTSGDNVWIQVTADMDFQGEPLTTGWNNITLD